MSGTLWPQQEEILLRAIKPGRVVHRDGQSNLEAYDVRAHLTRIFGFGNWDEISIATEMLYEEATTTKTGKPAFKVAYRADRAIVVRNPNGEHVCEYHGSAVGEAIMPDFKRGDAHDFAVKKAQSQALKRAAINLGDQFGLSLYAKGAVGVVVGKVVVSGGEMHEPDVIEEVDPDASPIAEEEDQEERVVPMAINARNDDDTQFLVGPAQITKMQVLFGERNIRARETKLDYIAMIIGRRVASSKEMTEHEASQVIDALQAT